ncbi:DNA polymerase III subunit [Candidatus Peregrinibacteria bacterium]|nr:DNA polymerase III subunit [Candidatus Peregrinibacteria bacterium]
MLKYPWDIIGHDRQLLVLEKEIAEDKLTHAYLFHGPKDTGKFTVASVLAKILLCPNNLCHQCRDCRLVKAGSHPDLIQMLDKGESIKIDDVRALVKKTNLTSQGKRRIVLIENLERMPLEAQNSFLKTLEEPAGETIFLMTSTQLKKIVPTILSRVRQMEFSLVPDDLMRKELRGRFKDHTDFEEVLQMAQGRPGLAIRLLSEPPALAAYKRIYNQIDLMLKQNDLTGKFSYVEDLEGDAEQLDLFFDIFCQILRKSAHDFLMTGKSQLSPRYNLVSVTQLFEQLIKTRYLIDRNANKKLALENFLLSTEK